MAVSVDMFMLYCDVMRPALRLVGVIECVGDGGGGGGEVEGGATESRWQVNIYDVMEIW